MGVAIVAADVSRREVRHGGGGVARSALVQTAAELEAEGKQLQ